MACTSISADAMGQSVARATSSMTGSELALDDVAELLSLKGHGWRVVDPQRIASAAKALLLEVGAFDAGMENLERFVFSSNDRT